MVKPERRPNTATLIKPVILDTKLQGIFDMSTVSREHLLAIKNLVNSPRCRCKLLSNTSSIKCESRFNEAEAKIQRMCKVLNKTYCIRNNAARKRLLDDLPYSEFVDKIPVIPAPCVTCGREDQPERFHSHPNRTEIKSKAKMNEKPNESKEYEPRKTVQKPVAIKFRSAKSKVRQKQVNNESLRNELTNSSGQSPVSIVINKEFSSPERSIMIMKHTVIDDENKENNVAAESTTKCEAITKSSKASKWKEAIQKGVGKMCDLRENNKISAMTTVDTSIDILGKDQQSVTRIDENWAALGGYKLDNWVPAPVSGGRKRKVLCYLCSQEFGMAALPSHEAQCIRKYLKSNEKNIESGKTDNNEESQRSQFEAREHWAVAWEITQASLTACKFCDRKFLPNRLEAHQRSCLRKTNKPKWNDSNTVSISNYPNTITTEVFPNHSENWHSSSATDLNYERRNAEELELLQTQQKKSPSQSSSFVFVLCNICGQNFDYETIISHIEKCRMKVQEDADLRSSVSKMLPQKAVSSCIDFANELSQLEIETQESQELFWKAHQEQLVRCPKCARTFFPHRLEVHLRSCKGPSKNKVK